MRAWRTCWTAWALLGVLLASVLAPACASGVPATSAYGEPLRVAGGQFHTGELPGTAPLTADARDAGALPSGASITLVEALNKVVRPGQGGKAFTGRASPGTVTLGVRFADLGTGYWTVPVDGPDPAAGGELLWQIACDFSRDLPAGLHKLRFAAIDAEGHAGTQGELELCLASATPDNLAACDPSATPPSAVVSLRWDAPVDLDLQVRTPDGKLVDAKHPSTASAGDAGVPAAQVAAAGVIDVDANRACSLDAIQRENLVWQSPPARGTYAVYANLFDACGRDAVHFELVLSLPEGGRLVQKLRRTGELTADQAGGGASAGLFVTELSFD